MRKVVLLVGFVISSVMAMAQEKDGKFRVSLGAEVGFPTGTSSVGNTVGIGGSLQLETFVKESISATGYIGFLTYFGKNKAPNFNVIPIRIGGRYYIGDALHFGLQLGVGITGGSGDGTAFAFSPQVGYNFKTSNGKAIDATFKYDGYSKNGTASFLGVRLAYIL